MYRWFTRGNSKLKIFHKWQFLSEQQILGLIKVFPGEDCFSSVCRYDKDQKLVEAPQFYADFDGVNAETDMQKCVERCVEVLGYKPKVYDSGSKGYHVISEITTSYKRYYKLSKEIINFLGDFKSYDPSVYRERNMWRIPNTYNVKGKRNKTLVSNGEIFNDKHIAVEKELIERIESYIPSVEYSDTDQDPWYLSIPPCIKKLLKEQDMEGNKHNTIFIITRFMRAHTASEEACFNLLRKCEWLNEVSDKDILVRVSSIYNSDQPPSFGCRDNDLLNERCSFMCKWYHILRR